MAMRTTYLTTLAATLLIAAWPGQSMAQQTVNFEARWDAQRCIRIGAAFRESDTGLLVADITAGAPAAVAGLRPGDRVTVINGRRASLSGLDTLVRRLAPGEMATFQVERGGREERIKIVAARGQCLPRIEAISSPGFEPAAGPTRFRIITQIAGEGPVTIRPDIALSLGARSIAGVELSELNPELAEYFRGADEGILVLKVLPETPGARSGLVPGDVIVLVDGKPVRTIEELRATVLWSPASTIPLGVVRKGKRLTVQLPLEH